MPRIYYLLKPAIPPWVRMTIRRFFARRLRRQVGSSWPIDQAAAETPAGWPGWPDGKKFAFVLTHDVEGRKGLEHCRALAEVEMRMGFRSSFNFVPEGEYTVPESFCAFLGENGFEVGIHDLHHNGSLYRSAKTFRSQARKINRHLQSWEAVGFRSGFMFHNLEWLQDLNVLYDSSTFDTDPFEPQPDGVQTIFPFWVPGKDGKGYVELPYTLPQDSTLFLLLKENSIDIWKRKLDWVAQKGGLALVIVHPDYIGFNGQKRVGEYSLQLYRDLLEYVANRYADQCWFALPKDVARHFYVNMVPGSGVNRCLLAQEQAAMSYPKAQDVLSGSPVDLQTVDRPEPQSPGISCLQGKRMAVVSFSSFPGDPRPRRAAETFVRAGMKVEVICLRDEGSPVRERFKGVEIDRIAIKHDRGSKLHYMLRYCLFILIAFGKLATRSLTRRYHVVHIHNMPDILVFAALVPKLFGAKVILDLHDPMPELMMTIFNLRRESLAVRLMARLEKWSIAFADLAITVNHTFERLFVSRSCPASKIRVVMNSPDEHIFKYVPAQSKNRQSNKVHRPFVIMYHGTLVERNGVDLAVEALVKLRQSVPEAELRIYGHRTPYLDQIMLTVPEKGLEKAVYYLGPRPLEQLTDAIAECDVGVIPNKRSIFTEINTPTRIFEYLALGKPVVAPRAHGIQEYFSEDSLIWFDLGNADDLALKLSYLFSHEEEVLEVVKRGQKVYLAHEWRKERRKLENVVVGLLSETAHFSREHVPGSSRKSRKKIGMLVYNNYETDNRVRRYAETLVKRGDQVDVIAITDGNHLLGTIVINGVTVHHIQQRTRDERSKWTYAGRLLRFLVLSSIYMTRLHRRHRFDLIHVHNVPDFLVFAAWVPKLMGAKLILDIHDIVPEFFASKFSTKTRNGYVRLLKLVEKVSMAFADHVIVSNHLWHEKLIARSVSREKSSVFINHVDPAQFYRHPRRRTDDKFIIVFPGGFQWHQGLDIAIEALARVKQKVPNAELHLYGSGNIQGDLARLAKQLNLNDSVKFCESVPHDEIAGVIANADLGIVPKRSDSFGNEAYSTKIMEFMSQGVPVVVSRTKIDTFYFDDSVVKFFESGNAEAMADAMLQIIKSPAMRDALIAKGFEYVARHSWDHKKNEYLDLVDSLCAGSFIEPSPGKGES